MAEANLLDGVGLEEKLQNLLVLGSATNDDKTATNLKAKIVNENLLAALRAEAVKEKKKNLVYSRPDFVNGFLAENRIRPLKKKSEKFPWARYFCDLCDYHYESLGHCLDHVKEPRHKEAMTLRDIAMTLSLLPKPSISHLEVLDTLLSKIENEFGLSEADLEERLKLAQKVNAIIEANIPGCSIRLFGSSATGFGLKDSDVNLDLFIVDGSIPAHQAFMKALQVIEKSEAFTEVKADFTTKIPAVSFKSGPLLCRLTLENHLPYQTTSLLKDYFSLDPRVRTLSAAVRLWARVCKMDVQTSGMLPAHAFPILLVFFLQQHGPGPILPCIHDQLKDKGGEVYESPSDFLVSFKSNSTTKNPSSAGQLWIEFFNFYSFKFTYAKKVVSLRRVGGIPKEETKWQNKRLVIEDPYLNKRPLSRAVVSARNLDFISDCFKIGSAYFGITQTSQGPIFTKIFPKKIEPLIPNHLSSPESGSTRSSTPFDVITMEELENSLFEKASEKGEPKSEKDEEQLSFEELREKFGTELSCDEALQISQLVPKEKILFEFSQRNLTGGKNPSITCSVCTKDGHLQDTCPEEASAPTMKPLPPLSSQQKTLLSKVCSRVMEDLQPPQRELKARERILNSLTEYVRRTFPDANLNLYGSSCNGFAIAQSDMDICLTFSGRPTDEDLNPIEIIEKLAKTLKKMQGIRNVFPIVSAKVPIVKFQHLETQIEADISFYNTLAQENTKMLRLYSVIDERVKILGYMVKFYAKICDMCDASRGSLSSYAYILLMLHYLQQCKPPVIPVLQELYGGDTKPVKMWNNKWNAWFFSDIEQLPAIWPEYGKNKESVAELWMGFLEYYAYTFDSKTCVVSVRQKAPLVKFEKMWMSKCFAIEDPFDLGHNLGGGLSRKMNLFIKRTFIKSREHFGTFHTGPVEWLMGYLFDPDLLCDGRMPTDRGCHACGRIGHFIRECPRIKAAEERKKNEKLNRIKTEKINSDPNKSPMTPIKKGSAGNDRTNPTPQKSTNKGMKTRERKSTTTSSSSDRNDSRRHSQGGTSGSLSPIKRLSGKDLTVKNQNLDSEIWRKVSELDKSSSLNLGTPNSDAGTKPTPQLVQNTNAQNPKKDFNSQDPLTESPIKPGDISMKKKKQRQNRNKNKSSTSSDLNNSVTSSTGSVSPIKSVQPTPIKDVIGKQNISTPLKGNPNEFKGTFLPKIVHAQTNPKQGFNNTPSPGAKKNSNKESKKKSSAKSHQTEAKSKFSSSEKVEDLKKQVRTTEVLEDISVQMDQMRLDERQSGRGEPKTDEEIKMAEYCRNVSMDVSLMRLVKNYEEELGLFAAGPAVSKMSAKERKKKRWEERKKEFHARQKAKTQEKSPNKSKKETPKKSSSKI